MKNFLTGAGCLWLVIAFTACCATRKPASTEPVKNVHQSIIEQEEKKSTPPNRNSPEKKEIKPSTDSLRKI